MTYAYRIMLAMAAGWVWPVVPLSATAAEERPAVASNAASTDWLRLVPGDAGFYAEIRDLNGIRRQFFDLGIWQAVRDLSERDPARATSRPWQQRTAEVLGLSPEAMISLVLGRRAALIAAHSGKWQEGVVLAEMSQPSDLAPLLRRWAARPQSNEGPVQRYLLRGGIMLAVLDRTIAFSPAGDPDGLWGRTVLLMAGRRGPSLAARSEFAGLRARLSRDYPGLLYVVWPPGDPHAVGNCTRLVVGVAVEPEGIRCELRGHRDEAATEQVVVPPATVGALPADSMWVWSTGLDFTSLARRIEDLEAARSASIAPMFFGALAGGEEEGGENLLTGLGPAVTLVGSTDKTVSSSRLVVPAFSVLVQTRRAGPYVERLDPVISLLGQILVMITTAEGQAVADLAVTRSRAEDVELHSIAIGPALAKRTGLSFLSALTPCWAVFDEKLVLSTSRQHVAEIIRAARRKIPRLDDADRFAGLPGRDASEPPIAEWFMLRGAAASQMCASWLRYVRTQHPQALTPAWWRTWAAERIERRTRLGLALADQGEGRPAAVVREILDDSPAQSHLQVGDVIVAVGGRPLATSRPAADVAERYRARGRATHFELQVVRNGEKRTVRIPVAPAMEFNAGDFDPIRALEQLVALSQRAETVTVCRYATEPVRFDARIDIVWDRTPAPELPEPPGQPPN